MNQHKKGLAVWIGIVLLLLAGALLAGPGERVETVQETMRDAVLHNVNRISLLGLKEVNPGLISAFLVTIIQIPGPPAPDRRRPDPHIRRPPLPVHPRQTPASAGAGGGPL